MRVIIAGSRSVTNYAVLLAAVRESGFRITSVVSGGAHGADTLGEKYAWAEGVVCTVVHPDWEKYGKRAGLVRNGDMTMYADALIALWDGKSRGTAHMIKTAKERGLQVHVHRTDGSGE